MVGGVLSPSTPPCPTHHSQVEGFRITNTRFRVHFFRLQTTNGSWEFGEKLVVEESTACGKLLERCRSALCACVLPMGLDN